MAIELKEYVGYEPEDLENEGIRKDKNKAKQERRKEKGSAGDKTKNKRS